MTVKVGGPEIGIEKEGDLTTGKEEVDDRRRVESPEVNLHCRGHSRMDRIYEDSIDSHRINFLFLQGPNSRVFTLGPGPGQVERRDDRSRTPTCVL